MPTQTEALHLAWSAFAAGLSQSDRDLLGQRWAGKRQPPPPDWVLTNNASVQDAAQRFQTWLLALDKP
ncbi:MAG: hypothetical protein ACKVJD_01585 [Burkholderiales bacterium]